MRRSLLAFLLMAVLAVPALADVVYLKDGSEVEGTVISEDATQVVVRLRYGTMSIPAADVDRIERGATREEELAAFIGSRDPNDPETYREAARWAEEHGLDWRARELQEQAVAVEVRRHVEAAGSNVQTLYEAALWVESQGYGEDYRERVLRQVIALDPDHEAARAALGYRRFEGRWLLEPEIQAIDRERFDRRMQADGYIRWHDEWVRPDAALLARELDEVDARERAVTDREREVESRGQELAQRERQVGAREADVEAAERHVDALRREVDLQRAELDRREATLDAWETQLHLPHTHTLDCPHCGWRWDWRCVHAR